MSAVVVRPIQLPKEAARFVKTWWPIYEGDPQWVPPLIFERKEFFDPKKNPYFKVARVQCFLAERDGTAVGTIAATVDDKLQETDPGVGMFGFFEFVDDLEVARALFEAATKWLREQGMTSARGPFNFNSNHEFGLLVDGFDTPPCVANPHNRDYYQAIYEQLGLVKVMDWYAYWLVNDGPVQPTIAKVAKRMQDRHPEVVVKQADMKTWDKDVEDFWELYNDAWEHNWGHIEFTKDEFLHAARGFKLIADPRLIFHARIDGELVAASLTLPDVNQVVKKMNGRLLPFGWRHLVFGRRNIDVIRVFVLGVKKKYQRMPLGALLYVKTWEAGQAMKVRGAEASLILETNHRMRGAMEKLGGTIYKTYRSYEIGL